MFLQLFGKGGTMQPKEIGIQPPPMWKLDHEKKPKNEAKFLKALKFLQDHPEWVNEHQKEAKKRFKLLERTEHLSENAKSIQRSLVEKFPTFFPTVLIKIGDIERQISKERLKAHSEKFKVLFKSQFKEMEEGKIELTLPEGIDNGAVLTFLTYLESGDIKIAGENALDLLRLAQDNNFSALAFDCTVFIRDSMDISSFKEILQAACHYQLTDLKWVCIVFTHMNWFKHKYLIEDEISEQVKTILNFGIQCTKFDIGFSVSADGKRSVRLGIEDCFKDKGLEFLRKVNQECPIEDLIINVSTAVDKDLENLAEFIPNLFSLQLGNCHMTSIPERWLQSLEVIDFHEIKGLVSFNARKAKIVDCRDCPELASIIAQNAVKVSGRRCENLTTIDASHVKWIDVTESSRIVSLNTSKAEYIYCNQSGITILDTLKAKQITCALCPITNIYAPEVEEINCFNTFNLISINAAKVKKINALYCQSLESIYAPELETIECSCPKLKNLTISKNCVIQGHIPRTCKITYVDSTATQKAHFKVLIAELIEKHKNRHQVLITELAKTIASFLLNPDIRIPLNELLDIAHESISAKEIKVQDNFNERVADEAIELLLSGKVDLSLVNKLPSVHLKKAFAQMKEKLITTESSEQRAEIAKVLLKANLLEYTAESAKALHDAAITHLRQLIAPDSEAFTTHEKLNEALGIAAGLLHMTRLTEEERNELSQAFIEAISQRRPPIYLETEEDFELDRRFKEVGQDLWNALGLGDFIMTFDREENE